MRMVFDAVPADRRDDVYGRFEAEISKRFEMEHRFAESSERKRVAIMVSREDHCLSDLLWRWRNGELGAEIVAVISNHADHRDQVASLGLPSTTYRSRPATARRSGARSTCSARRPRSSSLATRGSSPRIHRGPGAPATTSTTASCRPSSALTLTASPRARRQADRRYRPLRHRRPRRRPGHRPGRDLVSHRDEVADLVRSAATPSAWSWLAP